MKNRPSLAVGPSKPFMMELKRIWDVKSDRSYDARGSKEGKSLVAIRSRSGLGELTTDSRIIRLPAHTLILVDISKIRRYRCNGEIWEFWWFEFETSDPIPCALETVYPVTGEPCDSAEFEQMFSKLQSPGYSTRCIASAAFCLMFQRWLAESKLTREASPYRIIIESIIERIHNDIAGNWTLPHLSDEAGLCETLFRKEFKKATGKSPARFIREARLQAALLLIQQDLYTLSAIAEMLNFSSAFHLSAAFKKHYGVSPSQID